RAAPRRGGRLARQRPAPGRSAPADDLPGDALPGCQHRLLLGHGHVDHRARALAVVATLPTEEFVCFNPYLSARTAELGISFPLTDEPKPKGVQPWPVQIETI